MDQRLKQLTEWLHYQLSVNNIYHGVPLPLKPVSGDASFRRYYRCCYYDGNDPHSVIVVDAPPEHESCRIFVDIARQFSSAGVLVPECIGFDLDNGFMLLSDFGDLLLLDVLDEQNVDDYYHKAMNLLLDIMQADFSQYPLPLYDSALLQREMQLFPDWFCQRHLGLTLSSCERQQMQQVFDYLDVSAQAQGQIPVHRDFHSRNLMLLDDERLGVIDFQDAVIGPITYDLLSLLRDAYIAWPDQKVHGWVRQFAAKLRACGLSNVEDTVFWQWFNAIGAQRHLKVVGIFSRLCHRDGKPDYLNDIPLTLRYLLLEIRELDGAGGPSYLGEFDHWLCKVVVPALINKQPNARQYLEAFL